MTFANRIKVLQPSATMAVIEAATRLREQGIDVVSFGAGEPDFDTPPHIIERANQAMLEGKTRYTPGSGTSSLKAAVARKLKRVNQLEYEPGQIVVSNGGKHSLFNATMSLFQQGDEVIVLSPYWVTYPEIVKLAGAKAIIVDTVPENDFQVSREMLAEVITDRTKGIIVNSPSNPTGAVLDRDSLTAISELAVEHDFWIIADECYEALVYDGEHISIATLPGAYERTITLQTMSKAYAMTGWRMGFAAAPIEATRAMSLYQGQATGCPNSIAQAAAEFALDADSAFLDEWLQAYRRRRDTMVVAVNDIPEIHCLVPQGAFYTFPDVSAYFGRACGEYTVNNSSDMARYLLEAAHVVVVPGSAFGAEGYLRLSYATSHENVERGMRRLRKALEDLV